MFIPWDNYKGKNGDLLVKYNWDLGRFWSKKNVFYLNV